MAILRTAVAGASLATTLLAARPADACHRIGDWDGYRDSFYLGFQLGLTFAPKLQLVYGVDARFGEGRVGAVLRLEGHGFSRAKLVAAVTGVQGGESGDYEGARAHAEVGLALRSKHVMFGRSIGLHGAVSVSNNELHRGLRLFGTLPLGGHRADYDAGATAWTLVAPWDGCSVEGRPLLDGDRMLLPDARCLSVAGSLEEEAALARWTARAQAEASSVPSFVRLAAELRQLGAPRGLVDGALAAARDEVRHAHLCAAHAGGVVLAAPPPGLAAPRPAASEAAALARVGVEAWREGCVGEGIAAAEAPLASIARDEARHAELGWQLLRWAWQQGGPAVRRAIAAELDATVLAHDVTERARARARRQLAA